MSLDLITKKSKIMKERNEVLVNELEMDMIEALEFFSPETLDGMKMASVYGGSEEGVLSKIWKAFTQLLGGTVEFTSNVDGEVNGKVVDSTGVSMSHIPGSDSIQRIDSTGKISTYTLKEFQIKFKVDLGIKIGTPTP